MKCTPCEGEVVVRLVALLHPRAQSKVTQLYVALGIDQNVVGLDVSVKTCVRVHELVYTCVCFLHAKTRVIAIHDKPK